MAKKPKYYAVKNGRQTGIVRTWAECEKSIKGYSGAVYRSFEDEQLAQEWFRGKTDQPSDEVRETGNLDGHGEPSPTEPLRAERVSVPVDYDVYTDGSFYKGQYAWAYAFVKDGEVVYEESGVGKNPDAAEMRNVAGEIAAVLYAVRRAAELRVKIRIHHDYAGIAHWVNGEWRTKKPYTQLYVELMRQHQGMYSFVKVEAHTGNRFNEYVDKKAKEALGL